MVSISHLFAKSNIEIRVLIQAYVPNGMFTLYRRDKIIEQMEMACGKSANYLCKMYLTSCGKYALDRLACNAEMFRPDKSQKFRYRRIVLGILIDVLLTRGDVLDVYG